MIHLHDMLRSEDMREHHKAVSQLSLIPMNQAIGLLEELVHDSNGEFRARAIDALTKLFPKYGESLAIQSLDDPDWFVRVTSIDALSRLGSRTALPQILQLLATDPDEGVRSWAAFFLGVVGDVSVIPSLRMCMETDQGSDHEGTPIPEIAGKAIEKICCRLPKT